MVWALPPLAILALLVTTAGAAGDTAGAADPIAAPADSVTLAFTGDTLIHMPLSARARAGDGFDFRPMFTRVKPIIESADLSICHLEVPLSPGNDDLSGYPLFSAPNELSEALAYAGFDGCSTASNHSFDRGTQGVLDTISILEQAGLSQAGMAAAAGEAWTATTYEVGELTVAHIASTYWLNGLQMPADRPWLVQLLEKDQILGLAARSKTLGADLVVLSIHCCIEYLHEPTAAQRELYREMIGSPYVDLIVSHHSHVIGPVEKVDGEFILHGLGNFLSVQRQPVATADGVIAFARASNAGGTWSIADIEIVATWVEPGTYEIHPSVLVNPESYRRTMGIVNMYSGSRVGHMVWFGHPGGRLPR